ncbi:Rieske domain-containing protein-like [Oncorhynchus clarkii lewisi]|uniref:Rieske domain-containing protein-like n=1 Tax=Oncorhynchus clarkii lewisi TaxID=490388 RepID=UPI0039B8F21F
MLKISHVILQYVSSVCNISISMEEREERQEPATGLHFVGKKEDLIKAKRSFRTVEGRDILVLYHQETFYALDFHCYHAGVPLQNGDIETLHVSCFIESDYFQGEKGKVGRESMEAEDATKKSKATTS